MQAVWKQKFGPGAGPGPARQQSNVDLAILSPAGEVVHSFDGFRHGRDGEREPLAEYTARELKIATALLKLPASPPGGREPKLPDLAGARGMRVFVQLDDERMRAYRAPIVELVPMSEADWQPLAYPDERRSVEASVLKRWLSQIYPPGVMERVDPVSKRVYQIASTEGALSLVAAGADEHGRYAVLTGDVRLTDEGPDAFSYSGRLEVVLIYDPTSSQVRSVRGVFEGLYPRQDRMHNQVRNLPLVAVIESLPEA